MAALIGLHLGRAPDVPTRPIGGAAIRFLTAPKGVVRSVRGAELAGKAPLIVECSVRVSPGTSVPALTSNVGRLGHVLAVAENAFLADRAAETALAQVMIGME